MKCTECFNRLQLSDHCCQLTNLVRNSKAKCFYKKATPTLCFPRAFSGCQYVNVALELTPPKNCAHVKSSLSVCWSLMSRLYCVWGPEQLKHLQHILARHSWSNNGDNNQIMKCSQHECLHLRLTRYFAILILVRSVSCVSVSLSFGVGEHIVSPWLEGGHEKGSCAVNCCITEAFIIYI